jgi:hypothetical protein
LTIEEELRVYRIRVGDFVHSEEPTATASLKFWQRYHTEFPILRELAKIYLSTPGTSLASEAAFSMSAYIARKERAKLSPENLSFTMFMRDKISSEN